MSNAWYPKFKEAALQAGVNLSSGTVKAVLIDTAVASYNAAHQYYSSISAGAVGTPVTLASKTFTNGAFDAADVSVTGLSGAPSIEAVAIFIDTGSSATSPLVIWIDTATSGLPVAAGATQVDITWGTPLAQL